MQSRFILLLLLFWSGCIGAQDREHFNYILYCQGCHTADGVGAENAVPRLKDQIGYFLQVEGGREYLIKVPGAANSVLQDQDLASLMNWMVSEFSGPSLGEKTKPYTADEVAVLRREPILDVVRRRSQLVASIKKELDKKVQ